MQGRLRDEYLSVEIETECAHCGVPVHLTVDSDLKWRIREQDAVPLLFEPEIDWRRFRDPTIIDAY